jgi:hypothetical protein
VSVSSSSCSSSLSLPSFLPFRIPHCVLFWRFVLRAHPSALPLPHFFCGASLSQIPLCKTRFVYLCSSSLHSILLSHDIISVCVVCVFLWLRLVSLCLWLCSVEVCNPTFPLNLSLQVFFFFFWSSHLWFSIVFFSLVGEVLHAPWN